MQCTETFEVIVFVNCTDYIKFSYVSLFRRQSAVTREHGERFINDERFAKLVILSPFVNEKSIDTEFLLSSTLARL